MADARFLKWYFGAQITAILPHIWRSRRPLRIRMIESANREKYFAFSIAITSSQGDA